MSAMPCPAVEALKQFRLGRLADGPARVVEQHLHGCPACLARMPGLPLNDPIVNGLHGASARSRLNSPLLAQVQQQLRAQPFPRPGAPPARGDAPGSPMPPLQGLSGGSPVALSPNGAAWESPGHRPGRAASLAEGDESATIFSAPGSPGVSAQPFRLPIERRWLMVGGGVAAALLILIVFLSLPRKSRRPRVSRVVEKEKLPGNGRLYERVRPTEETGPVVPVVLDRGFTETWVTNPGPVDGVKTWCIETNDAGLVFPTAFQLTNEDLLIHYHYVHPPPVATPEWHQFDPLTRGLTAAPFGGFYAALTPGARTCARTITGGVQLWEVDHPEPRATLLSPGPRYSASFSPDGKTIVTANGDGNSLSGLCFWDVKATSKLGECNLPGGVVGTSHPTWSADSKALACVGGQNIFLFRSPWKEVPRLSRPRTVSALAWSPKGNVLATVEADHHVHLIDVENGKDVMDLPDLKVASLYSVPAWSPDGRELAFATADRQVVVWDLEKKKITFTFTGHKRDVGAIAFLMDGRTLISGSKGSVRFWDLQENRLRGTLLNLAGRGWLAIGPDGNYRCSEGGENRFVFKFRENNEELRDLSPENFHKVFGWKNQPDKVKLTGK